MTQVQGLRCRNCGHASESHRGVHQPRAGRPFTCGECVECYPPQAADVPTLPPTPGEVSAPDWVIIGYRNGPAFVVLGSIELTKAQLTALIGVRDADPNDPGKILRKAPSVIGTLVEAVMGRYVRAQGNSYAEALMVLMATWSAEGHGPAIQP